MLESQVTGVAEDAAPSPRLRCREIGEGDRHAVAALLARGFGCETDFWQNALARLACHERPADLPRYGYMLENDSRPVGALLLIFSEIEENGRRVLRCNVSSWYVEPAFRAFAPLLVVRALKHRGATYVNLTPAPQTLPILKAQGYREFCTGKCFTFPALGRRPRGARVETHHCKDAMAALGDFDRRLLRQHAAYGCLSLICLCDGEALPFVFAPRRGSGLPLSALLVYCRSLNDFGKCAGTLGRRLARRGIVSVTVYANGALDGVPGFFRRSTPIWYIGDAPPSPGNLAWSECAMFGVRA